MKLCVNCVHHELVYRGALRPEQHGCNRKKLRDVVDGQPHYLFCSQERGNYQDQCGPDAVYFEAKKP